MKHSGLAAELHVVHWTFLVDTEGKKGEEGESRESSIPHWGAEPSPALALPMDFQLCPAAHRCRDTGTHPLATRLHLCPMYGPEEHLHLADGQRPGLRHPPSVSRWKVEHPDNKPLSGWDCGQVTNCSPHTCPGASTSPLVSPHPQTARNRTSLIFHD